MTLFLNEAQVTSLLDMGEVVQAVGEVFRQQGLGEALNSPRTRSQGGRTVLSVMHASLPYLGRAGLKCYLSSSRGTRFLVVLFNMKDADPLAIVGADMLGRYRTGAASAVATKHLYRGSSARLAVFGTGRQALTQVLALRSVLALEQVAVWSPESSHRKAFATLLKDMGIDSAASPSAREAAAKADIGSTITSAADPFLDADDVSKLEHINVCGGNHPGHAELTPEAVGSFGSVFVDDLPQAKVEYGDLIGAVSAGKFAWERAMELGSLVSGKVASKGRSLFKSGGVAIMDVAVASLVYDKAVRNGVASGEFSFR